MIGNKHSTQVPHFDRLFNFKFFCTTSLYCENHSPTDVEGILFEGGREWVAVRVYEQVT
jgi:hypothetical protein